MVRAERRETENKNKTKTKLRALDLFAGTGLVSLALDAIADSVGYVEINSECQQLLRSNMAKGLLSKGAVFGDIAKFQKEEFDALAIVNNKNNKDNQIDLIMVSSPCTGFSIAGRMEGFENAASALFFEALRIVDAFKPPLIFFENVPGIRHDLGTIEKELCLERGYEIAWVVLPCQVVKEACQIRKRWFCLASKKDNNNIYTIPLIDEVLCSGYRAELDPRERLKFYKTKEEHKSDVWRMSALGNAVVPPCVRVAWNTLAKVLNNRDESLQERKNSKNAQGDHVNNGFSARAAISENNNNNSKIDRRLFIKPDFLPPFYPYNTITLVPNAFKKPGYVANALIKSPIQTADMTLPGWGTPRHRLLYGSLVVTYRNSSDLPTQLRFEKETPDDLRAGGMNPRFLEWLMMAPQDWTKIDRIDV